MITLLSRIFMKQKQNPTDPSTRQSYGVLCGSVGIFLNIALFLGKFAAGLLSRSISITADAFNNLSDAGSSIITLIGFRLSGQKPDPEHPFGHGRMEYISGFLVSVSIIIMAVELLKSSVVKVFNPEALTFQPIIIVILVISIVVKLYMAYYNTKIAKWIDSTAMKATATDSLSDCRATFVVLVVTLVVHFTQTTLPLDGICGVFVAISIFFSGLGAAKDTLSPLLGQPPKPEFVQKIEATVMRFPFVLGIHDLIVHDYGPGRLIISLHVEVPADGDLLTLHDTIDNIERDLQKELNCVASIHMDPIKNNDPETTRLMEQVNSIIQSIDSTLMIHDFRIVDGPTHTNILFDVVMPFSFFLEEKELIQIITTKIQTINPSYFTIIQIDRAYS